MNTKFILASHSFAIRAWGPHSLSLYLSLSLLSLLLVHKDDKLKADANMPVTLYYKLHARGRVTGGKYSCVCVAGVVEWPAYFEFTVSARTYSCVRIHQIYKLGIRTRQR